MDRSKTVLMCKRGRTLAHAVVLDANVDTKEFPVAAWWHPEEFGLRPMLQNGQPYPVAQAMIRLLSAGRNLGITERAKHLLDSVVLRNEVVNGPPACSTPAILAVAGGPPTSASCSAEVNKEHTMKKE